MLQFFVLGEGGFFKFVSVSTVCIAAMSCSGNKEIPEGMLVTL